MRERRGGNTMQMVQKREKVSPLRRGVYRNLWLLALLAAVFLLGCNTGQYRVAPLEVFWTLLGKGSPTAQLVLIEFRLPRLCLAAMVGLGMGMSGVIMQDLLHNDLASPGTLGVSARVGPVRYAICGFFQFTAGHGADVARAGHGWRAGFRGADLFAGRQPRKPLQPTRLIMTGVAMSSAYARLARSSPCSSMKTGWNFCSAGRRASCGARSGITSPFLACGCSYFWC